MFLEGWIKIFGRSLRLLFFPLREFLRAQEAREVEKWGRNAGGNF